jgi:hypothetical protein
MHRRFATACDRLRYALCFWSAIGGYVYTRIEHVFGAICVEGFSTSEDFWTPTFCGCWHTVYGCFAAIVLPNGALSVCAFFSNLIVENVSYPCFLDATAFDKPRSALYFWSGDFLRTDAI